MVLTRPDQSSTNSHEVGKILTVSHGCQGVQDCAVTEAKRGCRGGAQLVFRWVSHDVMGDGYVATHVLLVAVCAIDFECRAGSSPEGSGVREVK